MKIVANFPFVAQRQTYAGMPGLAEDDAYRDLPSDCELYVADPMAGDYDPTPDPIPWQRHRIRDAATAAFLLTLALAGLYAIMMAALQYWGK